VLGRGGLFVAVVQEHGSDVGFCWFSFCFFLFFSVSFCFLARYRNKLTGMSKMILERRLTPSCLKIQNQYRRRKATTYVARVRKAKALALARKRAKKIAADRRRKANQAKRDAMEAKHQAKLRARKREISKLLVKQLSNPTWETLNALLTEGNTALGEEHDLMVRGTRLLKALEKESAFQHYRKKKDRKVTQHRASARQFNSVDKELNAKWRQGALGIAPAPQSPPPNLTRLLMGDDLSPEKKSNALALKKREGRARPEVWENVV
jgi:hypothetical protein